MLKQRIATVALAAALFGSAVGIAGTSAQTLPVNVQTVEVGQNGAQGLIAATVDALALVNLQNNEIDIVVVDLSNSLNNLRALNNVLNNNDVDITVQDISVLNENDVDILNNSLNDLTAVVGVAVLGGQDFIVFTA